jgi:hypothetical protein
MGEAAKVELMALSSSSTVCLLLPESGLAFALPIASATSLWSCQ